jgi:hypothetical protein
MAKLNTNVIKIKEKVEVIIKDAIIVKNSMDELKEWDSLTEIVDNIVLATDFVTDLILAIEIAVDDLSDDLEGLKSGDKLDAAVSILDDVIELPWYLEIIDEAGFKMLISTIVSMMNKWFGNNWDLDFAKEALATGKDYIQLFKEKFISENTTEEDIPPVG